MPVSSQQKGNSQDVKDFGAMMVKDHSEANEKLQSIASAQGEKLPTSASVMQMAEAKKLKWCAGRPARRRKVQVLDSEDVTVALSPSHAQ